MGKTVFTLPICVRSPEDLGYPRSDIEVYEYFRRWTDKDQLSLTAHAAVACFLGACQTTMLKWLKGWQAQGSDRQEQFEKWYAAMETKGGWNERAKFFSQVVQLANSVSCYYFASVFTISHLR